MKEKRLSSQSRREMDTNRIPLVDRFKFEDSDHEETIERPALEDMYDTESGELMNEGNVKLEASDGAVDIERQELTTEENIKNELEEMEDLYNGVVVIHEESTMQAESGAQVDGDMKAEAMKRARHLGEPRPGPSTAGGGPRPPVALVPGRPASGSPGGRGMGLADDAVLVAKSPSRRLRTNRHGAARAGGGGGRARRSLRDRDVMKLLLDSDSGEDVVHDEDSEDEVKVEDGEEDDMGALVRFNDHSYTRNLTRRLRDYIVTNEEGTAESVHVDEQAVERVEEMDVEVRQGDVGAPGADHAVGTRFNWSANFSEFTGRKETYMKDPGPQFTSQDPLEIFLHIWDESIVNLIVRETNKYAWRYIAHFSDPDLDVRMPGNLNSWREITVEEVYRLLSLMVYMSMCPRSNLKEFWMKWRLEMPGFRSILSRNRYFQLCRFLHFVDNDADTSSHTPYQAKIHKIDPILQHCNEKFSSMYVPCQHLSLDESLLLWKGRLSWKQVIRTKTARFGIKSFELCEAGTGYLLRCILYGGKDSSMVQGPLHGFSNATAKVVLKLMEGYLNQGHVLVMDNWYNQIELTRYLKQHRTDVIGTMNRRRDNVPEDIKNMSGDVPRGTVVARHCGDISLTAWKDVKLVTVVSTYHSNEMAPAMRAGRPVLKPVAVSEYNANMGGVDLKDQKLSTFLFERKRGSKWYMKVFRRLVNTSLLNAYILYLRNPCFRVMQHREFRSCVAERLLQRVGVMSLEREVNTVAALPTAIRLNTTVSHYPVHTEPSAGKSKSVSRSCIRCRAAKRPRKRTNIMCRRCNVALCIGQCWEDYHTLRDL